MSAITVLRRAAAREHGPSQPWHARSADHVLSDLDSGPDGLTDRDAADRLKRDGPNCLPPAGASARAVLARQLRRLVVPLLAGAAAVSLLNGHAAEAIAIAAVLATTVGLSLSAAWRGRRTMEALRALVPAQAAVLREGRLSLVDASSLVAGDVIQCDAGSRVAADARLVQAVDLCVLETAVTGEPLPVEKTADALAGPAARLADHANMIHMGALVRRGSGRAVVTATGARTELGRIVALIGSMREEDSPFARRLDTLGQRMAWSALGLAATVALLGLWRGVPFDVVLHTAVAFVVAAMPLGLPIVVAVSLAAGVRRMARRHILVRRPSAVPALGSTSVICADTATLLTSGRMSVATLWTGGRYYTLAEPGDADEHRTSVDEPAVRRTLEFAVLASSPRPESDPRGGDAPGDPVDRAVRAALDQADVSSQQVSADHPPRAVLPFCCGRGLMATFHGRNGRLYAYVKGAPERVIALSDRVMTADGPRHLDDWRKAELAAANETLARDGLRVIAVAAGFVDGGSESALHGLTFEGLVGLADPAPPGLKESVEGLRDQGLRIVMITGDQRATAAAIGRQLGIIDAPVRALDGDELDALSPADLAAAVGGVQIFSRMSPEHRLRIVRALRRRGDVVVMLGGGANDAAALGQADVGAALGVRGTEAAKEAADITLEDDRLETAAAAVEEGRAFLQTSRTFTLYLFGCTGAELLVLLVAGLAALPLPLQPLQLLWLNLAIVTLPAVALAFVPGGPGGSRREPRDRDATLLSRPFLTGLAASAAALTLATLAVYAWGLSTRGTAAPTLAFMTLGLGQIVHAASARGMTAVFAPSRSLMTTPGGMGAVGVALVLMLATGLAPLAGILQIAALGPIEWGVVAAGAAWPAAAGRLLAHLRPSLS